MIKKPRLAPLLRQLGRLAIVRSAALFANYETSFVGNVVRNTLNKMNKKWRYLLAQMDTYIYGLYPQSSHVSSRKSSSKSGGD
jgi:hypothetical protein